jgi:phosphohistidine phosphatase
MRLFPELDLTLDAGITPDGDVYGVMDAIESYDLQQVLLVSHNPFLSNLLSLLVDGTMESHRPVGNATLHCVSMDVVAPGCGEILYTLEP